LYTIRFKK